MGCRIFVGREAGSDEDGPERALVFCSTSGWALGPIFDSHDEAQAFIDYVGRETGRDPRQLSEQAVEEAVEAFRLSRQGVPS